MGPMPRPRTRERSDTLSRSVTSCPLRADRANLAIVVFTNLGSEAGLICKSQLRTVTKPRCGEVVSRNPINKAFIYNGFPRF